MSNYLMLVSDRKISMPSISKEIPVPKKLQKELKFTANYAYMLEPIASDRKELIAKQAIPDFYNKTNEWFKKIYKAAKKVLMDEGKVILIETYYDQNLDDAIWTHEKFDINKFNQEELSFEFETIYELK